MKLSTQILLGFSLIIALSVLNSYVNYTLSQKVNQNSTFLTNSETIIRNSGRLHKSIIEMQSAFRGYLLTDDDDFLVPYYVSLKEIPVLFREQAQLVHNYPENRQKLDSMMVLHQQWVDYANSLITAKKKSVNHTQIKMIIRLFLILNSESSSGKS